jgi:hypothetical protein
MWPSIGSIGTPTLRTWAGRPAQRHTPGTGRKQEIAHLPPSGSGGSGGQANNGRLLSMCACVRACVRGSDHLSGQRRRSSRHGPASSAAAMCSTFGWRAQQCRISSAAATISACSHPRGRWPPPAPAPPDAPGASQPSSAAPLTPEGGDSTTAWASASSTVLREAPIRSLPSSVLTRYLTRVLIQDASSENVDIDLRQFRIPVAILMSWQPVLDLSSLRGAQQALYVLTFARLGPAPLLSAELRRACRLDARDKNAHHTGQSQPNPLPHEHAGGVWWCALAMCRCKLKQLQTTDTCARVSNTPSPCPGRRRVSRTSRRAKPRPREPVS